MPGTRIIKKYPNRRLYDTEESRYVTLANIRELVMRGIDFQVLDTNSGEDLTRSILLQIMLEDESGGQPLFSANMLAQIIRFYGGTTQGMFARYLEESLSLFTRQQERLTPPFAGDALQAMNDLARQNIKIWNEMQASFLKASGLTPDSKSKD